MELHLIHADAHGALTELADARMKFDAVITDPPVGLTTGVVESDVWELCWRLLRDGAYLCALGTPRLVHRQTAAIEAAGFQIRDQLLWLHEVQATASSIAAGINRIKYGPRASVVAARGQMHRDARRWTSWTTGLNASWMPIVMAQKLESADTLAWRVYRDGLGGVRGGTQDPRQLQLFPAPGAGALAGALVHPNVVDDTLLFRCNSPSWREASAGMRPDRNRHPDVRPIALMRWLIHLTVPPGRRVLDPFCGSGTTGAAAALENCDFTGVDVESRWLEVARRRIAHWQTHDPQVPRHPIRRNTETCRNGHPWTPDNIYRKPNGQRECRICKREAKQARRRQGATG